MFCTRCGTSNTNESSFCSNCSAPLPKPRDTPRAPSSPASWQNPPAPGGASQPQNPAQSDPYQPYSGAQAAYSGAPGYNQYQGGYGNQPIAQQSASGRSIAAMVMSIASIFTFGPLLSIPGMIIGKMEMNAIRDGRAHKAGEVFAKIGFYTGLVITILSCLGVLALIFIVMVSGLTAIH